jgi:hypothetical protein
LPKIVRGLRMLFGQLRKVGTMLSGAR